MVVRLLCAYLSTTQQLGVLRPADYLQYTRPTTTRKICTRLQGTSDWMDPPLFLQVFKILYRCHPYLPIRSLLPLRVLWRSTYYRIPSPRIGSLVSFAPAAQWLKVIIGAIKRLKMGKWLLSWRSGSGWWYSCIIRQETLRQFPVRNHFKRSRSQILSRSPMIK